MSDDALLPMRHSPLMEESTSVSPFRENRRRPGRALPPNPPSAEDFDPLELLRILLRRWGWFLAGLGLALGGALVRFRTTVPVYEAKTSLRFDVAASMSTPIPGVDLQGMVGKNELATEMVSIKSFALARDVVDALRLDVLVLQPVGTPRELLVGDLDTAPTAVAGTYVFTRTARGFSVVSPGGGPTEVGFGSRMTIDGLSLRLLPEAARYPNLSLQVTSRAAAAERLRGAVTVTRPDRDASVLEVAFRSPDPSLARQVPDVLARRFIERQTRRRQSGSASTADFISQQLDTLDVQLATAEARLRDWRQRNRVVQPTVEAGSTVQQRAQYEALLSRTNEDINILDALFTGKGSLPPSVRSLPGYRRVLSSPLAGQTQAGSSILGSILRLEEQKAALLGSVTERDPQVQLINRTLADYERQGEQFVQNYLASKRAEAAAYERLLGTVGRMLAEVPERELELKTLERDVEVLSSLQLVLRQRLKESQIANASEIPTVEVLDAARPPRGPVEPQAMRFVLFGTALGVLAGALLAFVRDGIDRTIHTAAAVQEVTGAMMVGLIPSFRVRARRSRHWRGLARWRWRGVLPAGGSSKGGAPRARTVALERASSQASALITVREPRHVSSEAYRTLRANLRLRQDAPALRVIAVASPSPGDGKSTTTANLAVVLALQGERVLIIDTDLRRGALHKLLGSTRKRGCAELLAAHGTIEEAAGDAVDRISIAGDVTVELIPAGKAPENPTELLGGERWRQLISWARHRYDAVLVDTPPVNMFADALVACAHVDGLLLVVRAGKSRDDEVEVAAAQVRAVQIPLVGVVLNDFDVERDGRYGNYRYYRYYYTRYYDHYATPDGATGA